MRFSALCREVERTDPALYPELLEGKASEILPEIEKHVHDKRSGAVMLGAFIVGAMLADKHIDETEFELLKPKFGRFFGDAASYDECARMSADEREGVDMLVECVKEIMAELDEDVREQVVLVCLMICAVDGKVSASEKRWIKRLVG